jgi:hypothetical protein
MVAVAADGTVPVTYYDFRNNSAAPGALTDYWLSSCHPSATAPATNPASWSELRLNSTSFDLEQAPSRTSFGSNFYLGDYEGLAAAGNDFVAAWGMADGTATLEESIFFRRAAAARPQIGSFTASPNPVTAGSSVTLTAANVVALNPGSTVTQVAFYLDSNGDGILEPGSDTLLGYGTRPARAPGASPSPPPAWRRGRLLSSRWPRTAAGPSATPSPSPSRCCRRWRVGSQHRFRSVPGAESA